MSKGTERYSEIEVSICRSLKKAKGEEEKKKEKKLFMAVRRKAKIFSKLGGIAKKIE